jgi:hypothetical protein
MSWPFADSFGDLWTKANGGAFNVAGPVDFFFPQDRLIGLDEEGVTAFGVANLTETVSPYSLCITWLTEY